MRKSAGVLLAVLMLTPSVRAQSFFGTNGVSYFHYRDDPDAAQRAAQRVDWIHQAGAKWDRFDLWWGIIEPKPGQWSWTHADRVIDLYSRAGIEMLPILCYKAEWMKGPPATKQDFAQFAEYVRQCVTRYKGRVKHWEIWNEPNIPTFWNPPNVEHYAKLMKAAYKSAKQADPDCVIIGAATSETDINFILNLAKHGALDSMDVLSFHPYSMSDGPEEMDLHQQIRNVRKVLADSGKPNMPIWITEMGWQARIDKPDDVAKQARYMVQSHVIALAEGVERLFWFNLQDWGEGDKIEAWGMVSPDGKVKPTLARYREMVDRLEGARFRGYLPLENGVIYVFERGRKTFGVGWAHRGKTQPRGSFTLTPDPIYIDDLDLTGLTDRLPAREILIVNPSFEEGGEKDIYGWNKGVFYGGADKGDFAVSSEAADGKRAASISKSQDALWQSFPVYSVPGESFTLTAKIKTIDATGENGGQILFLAGPGWEWKGGPMSKTITGTTDWQQVSISGTVPADANVVRVNLVSKNNAGTVLFDDLKLSRKK